MDEGDGRITSSIRMIERPKETIEIWFMPQEALAFHRKALHPVAIIRGAGLICRRRELAWQAQQRPEGQFDAGRS
jgi:hypothetical protein